MPLGRQFENTYWEDPSTGETKSWSRRRNENGLPDNRPSINSPEGLSEAPHQGMLFHPETATGRRDDPLIPISRRKNAAMRALGLNQGVAAYRKRASSMLGDDYRNRPPSLSSTVSDMVGAREALVNSPIPIQELERINAHIAVNPREGLQYAESQNGRIRLSRTHNLVPVEIPEQQVPVTTPSTEPVFNPSFWKWYNKYGDNIEYEGRANIAIDPVHYTNVTDEEGNSKRNGHSSIWHNPETGHSGSFRDVIKHVSGDEDGEGSIEGNFDLLERSGYIPNIFPGKGKPSKNHHASDFNVETMNWETDRYGSKSMHSRWKPGEVTYKTQPARTEYRNGPPTVNSEVLIHEIGHSRDPGVKFRDYDNSSHITREGGWQTGRRGRMSWQNDARLSTADPLYEGTADGYADRHATEESKYYAGSGDMYEDAVQRAPMSSGYGVDSKKWKNKTHKALYVAARAHARASERGVETSTPNRTALMHELTKAEGNDPKKLDPTKNRKHLEEGNTMMLGHMYETMPHIRAHLEANGLTDVAKKAHKAYTTRVQAIEDAKYKETRGEQLSFDF